MTHRRASLSDIPKLIDAQKNDGFSHQYYLTCERLEKLFKRGEQFFVVEHNGKIVGFGSVDCEIRAQVHFICVDKKYSRQGAGRELIKCCLDEAKDKGCKRACSFVEANSSKEPFLIKMGFHQVGFYKDRYGNGIDASIWEVSLI